MESSLLLLFFNSLGMVDFKLELMNPKMLSEEFVFQVEKEVEEGFIKKRWKMCSNSRTFSSMILEIMFGCYSMLSNLQQHKVHFLLNHPWIPPVITKLWPAFIRRKSYGKTIFVPGPYMGIVCPTHIPLLYFSTHHETVMNI